MRSDDPSLKRLKPPKLTLFEQTYLPQILGGLVVTGRHIVNAAVGTGSLTMEYPEVQHQPSANYRGVHRLNKDDQGRVKCVACMLCATACPVHCIDIVGATAPEAWTDREKYCQSFVIDELRCIYCGMCEEVCPEEAIFLKKEEPIFVGTSRQAMIRDKQELYRLGGVVVRPIKKWDGK